MSTKKICIEDLAAKRQEKTTKKYEILKSLDLLYWSTNKTNVSNIKNMKLKNFETLDKRPRIPVLLILAASICRTPKPKVNN